MIIIVLALIVTSVVSALVAADLQQNERFCEKQKLKRINDFWIVNVSFEFPQSCSMIMVRLSLTLRKIRVISWSAQASLSLNGFRLSPPSFWLHIYGFWVNTTNVNISIAIHWERCELSGWEASIKLWQDKIWLRIFSLRDSIANTRRRRKIYERSAWSDCKRLHCLNWHELSVNKNEAQAETRRNVSFLIKYFRKWIFNFLLALLERHFNLIVPLWIIFSFCVRL